MRTNGFVILLMGALSAACADSPNPLVPPPGPVQEGPCAGDGLQTPELELEALQRAKCERQLECGVPLVNQATNLEACLAQLRTEDVANSLAARGSEPSARNACLCRQGYVELSCGALTQTLDPACGATFVGPGAAGAACSTPYDCQEGLQCDARDQCPGRCSAEALRCTEGSCEAGDYCDGISGRCTALVARGQECLGRRCGPDDYCGYAVDMPFTAPPTCVAVAALGARCISAEGACPTGAACLSAAGEDPTCQPGLAIDQPCHAALECGVGLYCDFDVSLCRPQAQAGAPCLNYDRNCAEGLYCRFPETAECSPDNLCGHGKECCQHNGAPSCVALTVDCAPIEGVCAARSDAPPKRIELLSPGDDCLRGDCPLGTACRLATTTATIVHCEPLLPPGARCADLALFNPYTCATGLCDLLGTGRCVDGKLPGEACVEDSNFTFQCASLRCEQGLCADWDALCQAR